MPKRKNTKSAKPSKKKKILHYVQDDRGKRLLHSARNDIAKLTLRTKILFLVGSILILIPVFFYINEGVQLAFFTPKVPPAIAKTLPQPTWISIPSVDMQLPVIEEAISNNVWGIADNGISHLNTSARPGESGPIILYGHNTNDRFGPIRWLSKGAKITLTAGEAKQHVYVVTQTMDVSPNQVSILLTQKGETLILYTCDGFADLKRFVVIAKPI